MGGELTELGDALQERGTQASALPLSSTALPRGNFSKAHRAL